MFSCESCLMDVWFSWWWFTLRETTFSCGTFSSFIQQCLFVNLDQWFLTLVLENLLTLFSTHLIQLISSLTSPCSFGECVWSRESRAGILQNQVGKRVWLLSLGPLTDSSVMINTSCEISLWNYYYYYIKSDALFTCEGEKEEEAASSSNDNSIIFHAARMNYGPAC